MKPLHWLISAALTMPLAAHSATTVHGTYTSAYWNYDKAQSYAPMPFNSQDQAGPGMQKSLRHRAWRGRLQTLPNSRTVQVSRLCQRSLQIRPFLEKNLGLFVR